MLLADPAADSLALRAQDNLARNTAALGLDLAMPPLNFRLAHDGSLSAYDNGWLGGISVPRRGTEVMLRNLTVEGNVACLVLPVHAQQIVACLAKLPGQVAVIALLGNHDQLAPTLACHDFADHIRTGRLMFAWDAPSLTQLFADRPGLPIPQQFVRTATASAEQADPVMAMAKTVFVPVVQAHADRIRAVHALPVKTDAGLCVVASHGFSLWNDAGRTLAETIGGEAIDTDIASQSGSAHIAERVAEHRAIVTADIGRADRAELAGLKQPWIAWITQPRVPAFVPTAPRDALLLAGERFAPLAAAAGWPKDRVALAAYPLEALPAAGQAITILAALPSLTPPAVVEDFSSWRVIWDTIAAELQADPLRLGADPSAYLDRKLQRADASEKNLPRDLFLTGLIEPSFTIGIARLLAERGQPAAIYGDGWPAHSDLMLHGAVADRATLRQALSAARVVIDCSLTPSASLRSVDRPIVRPLGMMMPALLAQLRSPQMKKQTAPRLSVELVDAILSGPSPWGEVR